jgi:HptB-dependent secretion and biofilm anti anti-sigma factor
MFDVKLSSDDSTAMLNGQLVFGEHTKFREMTQHLLESRGARLVIDFAGVDFIDSAGLGMLLLLRNDAKRGNRTVVLRKGQNQVKRIFEVSRFDTLFTIES